MLIQKKLEMAMIKIITRLVEAVKDNNKSCCTCDRTFFFNRVKDTEKTKFTMDTCDSCRKEHNWQTEN